MQLKSQVFTKKLTKNSPEVARYYSMSVISQLIRLYDQHVPDQPESMPRTQEMTLSTRNVFRRCPVTCESRTDGMLSVAEPSVQQVSVISKPN